MQCLDRVKKNYLLKFICPLSFNRNDSPNITWCLRFRGFIQVSFNGKEYSRPEYQFFIKYVLAVVLKWLIYLLRLLSTCCAVIGFFAKVINFFNIIFSSIIT